MITRWQEFEQLDGFGGGLHGPQARISGLRRSPTQKGASTLGTNSPFAEPSQENQ